MVARIIAMPWVRNRLGNSQDEVDFLLPRYDALDDDADHAEASKVA